MNGKGEPRLIFPGLAGFYASVSDLWYAMIRVAIGAILFMHGYFKVANGLRALCVPRTPSVLIR